MSILKTKRSAKDSKKDQLRDKLTARSLTAVNLMIDSDLHTRFKAKTALNKISMTDAISTFITSYVKDNPRRGVK